MQPITQPITQPNLQIPQTDRNHLEPTQPASLAHSIVNSQPQASTKDLSNYKVTLVLPQANATNHCFNLAMSYGVANGLAGVISENPSLNASNALTIMENIHKSGYVEKVSLFARFSGGVLLASLPNPTQKAEYAIRLAKLVENQDVAYWRDQATEFLKDEAIRCPYEQLIDLAILYAKSSDLEYSLYWLNRANTTPEDAKKACEIFFRNGLFNDGLIILDTFVPETVQNSKDESSWGLVSYGLSILDKVVPSLTYKGKDHIDLIRMALNRKELIKDKVFQHALLNLKADYWDQNVPLQMICYLGNKSEAAHLASEMCLRDGSMSLLLALFSYFKNEHEYSFFLKLLRETALTMKYPADAVSQITRKRKYTVAEDIETIKLLQKPWCIANILRERKAGYYYKPNKSEQDYYDARFLITEMMQQLKKFKFHDPDDHPPHWIDIIKDALRFNFIDLAIDACKMYNEWREVVMKQNPKNEPLHSESWILSFVSVVEIATGHTEQGFKDLERCHELYKGTTIFPTNIDYASRELPKALLEEFNRHKSRMKQWLKED